VIRPAFALLLACGAAHAAEPCKEKEKAQPVRVTVVVILATTENNVVDKKLTELATEMQKRYPDLVGFKLVETLQKSIPVGESHTFDLLEEQKVTVAIDRPKDKDGRVGLTVTAPGGDAVTYACACEKFFPLVTPYKTKGGSRLLLAIGGKPCTGTGP
jgi:hypothetical protein